MEIQPPTQTPQEVSTNQALSEAAAQSVQTQESKQATDEAIRQQINESARVFTDLNANKATLVETAKDVLVAGAALTGAATVAFLGVNAMDAQATHVVEENQQNYQEAEQNQLRSDFENGLMSNQVTIDVAPVATPPPNETAIPSPVQINPEDLPPLLPSPDTH